MKKGVIHIYAGEEKGGFETALGKAVLEAAQGKPVIVIRFLKEDVNSLGVFAQRLEPELKIFDFYSNIFNGMNFARKVLTIEECELLILDGIFELIEAEAVSVKDVSNILEAQGETNIILSGRRYNREIVTLLSVDSPRFECYDITINNIK